MSERTSPDAIHRTRLEVHENGTWNIAPPRRLVEVDVDSLKLQVAVTVVCTSRVDAVLALLYMTNWHETTADGGKGKDNNLPR